MDTTLLKLKKYYRETDAANQRIKQLKDDDDLSDYEKARQERLLLRNVEQRRQATLGEIADIMAERIKQAKQAEGLSSESVNAVNAAIQAINSLGPTATARDINAVLASVKGNNAALTVIHRAVQMNSKIRPSELAQADWGLDPAEEVGRHEAMVKILEDGLHPSTSSNLEVSNPDRMRFNVGLRLFGEKSGYLQPGEAF